MLNARDRMNQEARLNRNPLNQACRELLPPDWRGPPGLHCLNLLLWATDNVPYRPTLSPAYLSPSQDEVDAQVAALLEGNPVWAMNYLTKAVDAEDEIFGVGDLARAKNPEEAGAILLAHLQGQMLAR